MVSVNPLLPMGQEQLLPQKLSPCIQRPGKRVNLRQLCTRGIQLCCCCLLLEQLLPQQVSPRIQRPGKRVNFTQLCCCCLHIHANPSVRRVLCAQPSRLEACDGVAQ